MRTHLAIIGVGVLEHFQWYIDALVQFIRYIIIWYELCQIIKVLEEEEGVSREWRKKLNILCSKYLPSIVPFPFQQGPSGARYRGMT